MTESELKAKQDAEAMARQISNYLNTYGFNTRIEALMSEIDMDHRTLQQTFTKMCVAWLNHCGSDEYRYDGRNEASHTLGKKFKEVMADEQYLPFI